MAIWT